MTAPVLGASVTSANPNTQTNTSIAVALGSTVVGALNVIEITGDSTGTGIAPVGMAIPGWALVGEKADTNAATASSSSYIGVFYRVFQAGDPSSVTATWTNAGQMVAVCTSWTGFDTTAPVPYFVAAELSAATTSYTISGTTGTAAGTLAYGAANRAGSTAWTGLSDIARAQVQISTAGVTMVSRVVDAEVAGGTAFTKTMTGTSTSVGVSWAYVVKSAVATPPPGPTGLLATWLGKLPLYVAHRGGSTDYVEMTRAAYTSAMAYGATAINIDAVRCSTGEFVASHDTTTGRVFGTNYTIGTTPWSTLSTLTTSVGGYPIEKVADLLAAFPNVVVFVENKGNTADDAALLDVLDAAGGKGRIVIKQYYTAAQVSTDAKARGYTTWGYYYAADLVNLASTHSRWDLLGLDYLDTNTADWTTIKSYGKPVLGHVIPSVAGAAQAFNLGADGIMTGKIVGVIPRAVAALTGSMFPYL